MKKLLMLAIVVAVVGSLLGTAVSAQPPEVDKDYRDTNVCFEKDNDGDGEFNEDPVGDANGDGCPGICGVDDDGDTLVDEGDINDDDEDGDVDEDSVDCPEGTSLGDLLPQDADGNYQLEAVVKKNGKVSSYNPGQYYAVSTVNVLEDVATLTIVEDWTACAEISALNPPNGGGSVVIVEIGGDGKAYQILDAKSANVTISGTTATAVLNGVSAGTTILMYVKFGPGLKGEVWQGPYDPCENINKVVMVDGTEYSANANLVVVEKD